MRLADRVSLLRYTTAKRGRAFSPLVMALGSAALAAALLLGGCSSWGNHERVQIDASQQPSYGKLPTGNERFQVDPSDPSVGNDYARRPASNQTTQQHWNQRAWEAEGYDSAAAASTHPATNQDPRLRQEQWPRQSPTVQTRSDSYNRYPETSYRREEPTFAAASYPPAATAQRYDAYGQPLAATQPAQWPTTAQPATGGYRPPRASRPVVTSVNVRPLDQTQLGAATIVDYTPPTPTAAATPTYTALPAATHHTPAEAFVTPPAPTTVSTSPTPSASTTTTTATPEHTLDSAVATLEHLLAKNPSDAKTKLALQVLYAAQGADSDRVTNALILAAEAMDESHADDPEAAARAVDVLEKLHDQVAERAELIIENVKLCSAVSDFGNYDELSANTLASGEPLPIWIYCELKNFKSEIDGDGKYVTRLRAQILLYDENMNVLTPQPPEDVIDVPSAKPRHDFFLKGRMNLPALPRGSYTVVIKIEDRLAEKIARDGRAEFRVTGRPTGLP